LFEYLILIVVAKHLDNVHCNNKMFRNNIF